MQPKETLIKLDAYITEARTPLRALRKLSSIVAQAPNADPLNSREQQTILDTYLVTSGLSEAKKAIKVWAFEQDFKKVTDGVDAASAPREDLERTLTTLSSALKDPASQSNLDATFKAISGYPSEKEAAPVLEAAELSSEEIDALNRTYGGMKNASKRRTDLAELQLDNESIIAPLLIRQLSSRSLSRDFLCGRQPMSKYFVRPSEMGHPGAKFHPKGLSPQDLSSEDWAVMKQKGGGAAERTRQAASPVFSGGESPDGSAEEEEPLKQSDVAAKEIGGVSPARSAGFSSASSAGSAEKSAGSAEEETTEQQSRSTSAPRQPGGGGG